MHATYAHDLGRKDEARSDLEAAMAETAILEHLYKPEFSSTIKALYAGSLIETGSLEKALDIFRELCAGPRSVKLQALLDNAKACP